MTLGQKGPFFQPQEVPRGSLKTAQNQGFPLLPTKMFKGLQAASGGNVSIMTGGDKHQLIGTLSPCIPRALLSALQKPTRCILTTICPCRDTLQGGNKAQRCQVGLSVMQTRVTPKSPHTCQLPSTPCLLASQGQGPPWYNRGCRKSQHEYDQAPPINRWTVFPPLDLKLGMFPL